MPLGTICIISTVPSAAGWPHHLTGPASESHCCLHLQGLLDMPMLRRADRAAAALQSLQLVAQRVDLAAITPDQVPLLLTAQELGERRADGYAALVAPALGGECNSKTGRCAGRGSMGCVPCACGCLMLCWGWMAGCGMSMCATMHVSRQCHAKASRHMQACSAAVAGAAS